jgi:hypothetical protein
MFGVGECSVAADQIKDREPAFIANDGLAIDQTRANWKATDRLSDKGKAMCEIVSIAGNQLHAG